MYNHVVYIIFFYKKLMDGSVLKERILEMKARVESTEKVLNSQIESLAGLESLWNEIDSYAEYMRTNQNHIVTFIVCGK